MNECYVCCSKDLIFFTEHKEWHKPLLKCNICNHVALYDSVNNKNSGENFVTNKQRADRYLNLLKKYSFNSILEIGTPSDCYFLNKVNIDKLFSFDPFTKKKNNKITFLSKVKNFVDDKDITIHMMDTLNNKKFDLLYATHVMEHVPNINSFINAIKHCNNFIIEIPCYNEQYFKNLLLGNVKSTSFHYQFFNTENIIIFIKKHKIKTRIIHHLDDVTPYNKGNIVITNLPLIFGKKSKEIFKNNS